MRILRLVAPDDWMIEFHPYVSVLVESDEPRRDAIVEAFRSVSAGSVPPLEGLLEGHGVVLDLTQESLEVLEVGPGSVDVVVSRQSLPAAVSAPATRELRSAERRLELLEEPLRRARAELDEREAEIGTADAALAAARRRLIDLEQEAESREQRNADIEELDRRAEEVTAAAAQADVAVVDATERLDALREAVASREADCRRARDALDAAEAALEGVESEAAANDPDEPGSAAAQPASDSLVERLREVEEAIEELERDRHDAEAELDHDAHDALHEATASLAEHEALMEVAIESLREAANGASTGDELSRLREEADAIRAEMALASSYDATSVSSALEVAEFDPAEAREAELALAREIDELADQIEHIDTTLAQLAGSEAAATSRLRLAADRLSEAERALDLLQEEARAPLISDADRDEIERVHADVEAAAERLDAKRGRGKSAEDELEAARRTEREYLEKLGFHSYTDYLTGSPVAGSTMLDKLAAARTELASARLEVETIEQGPELRMVRDLRTRRVELQEKAEDLIVRSEEPATATANPELVLGDALASAGLPVDGLDLARDELIELAHDWLEVHALSHGRVAERVDRLGSLDTRIEELVDSLENEPLPTESADLPRPDDTADPEDSADPGEAEPTTSEPSADVERQISDLEEERLRLAAALEAAEQRVAAHQSAEARVAEVEAQLAETRQAREALLAEPSTEPAPEASPIDEDDTSIEARREALDEARDAMAVAEQELASATEKLERAVGELAGIVEERDGHLAEASELGAQIAARRAELVAPDTDATSNELPDAVRRAEDALRAARDGHAAAESALAVHSDRVAEQQRILEELRSAPTAEAGVPPEEVEWFLLERLAAHRDVTFGGSLPIVVDGVVDDLVDEELGRVLDRLSRLAGTVQVILVSTDERVAAWAEAAGEQRAVVVRSQVSSAA